jgi:thioredoxin reductase (NADPH)
MEEVITVRNNGETKTVVTDSNEYEAYAVIFACGAKHRMLGLENEENFVGNGISFCAVCDGAFYNGKEVAVIGGGNSALQEALLLSQNCKKVNIIQNLGFLTGEDKLIKALEAKDNVSVTLNTVVSAFLGDSELTGIRIKNAENGEEKELTVDGVFVAIGLIPDNDCAKELLSLDERGYIPADESTLTEVDGIFVAGDCRTKTVRQIATAISDGATAALSACKYIENK